MHSRLTAALVVTVAFLAITSSGAMAESDMSLSINSPSNPALGESDTISASINLADVVPNADPSSNLTIELLANGSSISTQNITVTDGEAVNVSFSYQFRTSGPRNVTIAAQLEFTGPLGQTYSLAESSSTTVYVGKRSGAALPVPKELEDEVADFRSSRGITEVHSFVLATPSDVFLVFTETEPKFGAANVGGTILQTNFSSGNTTLGVITGSNLSFDTRPTEVELSQASSTPESYELEHVAISANHSRIGLLVDPDQGNNVTAPITTGVLTNNTSDIGFTKQPGSRLRKLSQNLSTDASSGEVQRNITLLLGTPYNATNSLPTVGFRHAHWAQGPATVEGIVFIPGSAAFRYIQSLDQMNATAANVNHPVLYTLDRTQSATQYANVTQVRTTAVSGSYVEVTANVSGVHISTQEVLEHTTSCTVDQFPVQTPSGPVCTNLPVDVSIHAKMAFNGSPSSSSELLPVVGLATTHSDKPRTLSRGRYQLTGKIVSSTQIDASLPETDVLFVYDADRKGNYTLRDEIQQLVEKEVSTFNETLDTQLRKESTVVPDLRGDINNDGEVGIQDAVLIGQSWRCTSNESCYSETLDLNGDGAINIFDAAIVGRYWGMTA